MNSPRPAADTQPDSRVVLCRCGCDRPLPGGRVCWTCASWLADGFPGSRQFCVCARGRGTTSRYAICELWEARP
jgi:hypothetical protein